MKKIFITISAIAVALSSSAQDNNNFEPFKDRQFIFDSVNICAMLLVIYLLSNFIVGYCHIACTFFERAFGGSL